MHGTRPRRPLKVLFVGGDFAPYGAPRIQASLLTHLDRTLFEPRAYFLRDEGAGTDLEIPRVPLHLGVKKAQRTRTRAPKLLRDLIGLARSSDIVVSMLEGPPLYLSCMAARATGRPLVSWIHNNWSALSQQSQIWHHYAARYFLPQAARTICVSEGVRRDIVGFCPSLETTATALPNPVPLDRFAASKTMALPEWAERIFDRPVVIGCGQLIWQKGFEDLIRATAMALGKGADFNLLILGEGISRADFEGVARDAGIADRVFMPGYVANPFPFFRRAHAFVLSSHFEGLPTVLIEALAAGLPVISYRCPYGPEEILADGTWGRLVPHEDVRALGEAIARGIKDPAWLEPFRTSGPKRAKAYAADAVIRRFENILLEAVHA